MLKRAVRAGLAAGLVALLAACGGGGPDPDPAPLSPVVRTGPPRIEPYERVTTQVAVWAAARPTDPAPLPVAAGVAARLGPLEPEQVRVKSQALAQAPEPGVARQIGLAREIGSMADAAATAPMLSWQPTASGGQAAAVTFSSDGAAGLRLALRVARLPAEAIVRARSTGSGDIAVSVSGGDILATLARNEGAGVSGAAARTYWLPAVAGDAMTVEIELPAGVDPARVQLAMPRLSHLWWTHAAVSDAGALKIGQAGSCNVDATCSPNYAFESRAIARMEFVRDGTAFLCTGTLLADVGATGMPYFLSAHHCIGDQAAASTLSTYWFYRAAACNSNELDPAATLRHGGATLLYSSQATDTSFMLLAQSPPAGAVHAGSLLAVPSVGTALAGLHHPGGDLLKLSLGETPAYASCNGTRCATDGGEGDFIAMRWHSGTTESGSSGSAVFAAVGARRYLVGQLFAGLASCSRPDALDYYGRFDRAYPALREWLGTPLAD